MGLLQRIAASCSGNQSRKDEANRLIKENLDSRVVSDWQDSMEDEIASKSASGGINLNNYRWSDEMNDWVIDED